MSTPTEMFIENGETTTDLVPSFSVENMINMRAAAIDRYSTALRLIHEADDIAAKGHVGNLRIASLPRVGGPAVSIIAPRAEVDSIVGKLLKSIADSRRIDSGVIEAIRIENGIARIGVDTMDKTIALEARLERAISLNKGCYLGQETIERATARGGLKKRMFGIKFNGPAPSAGASLSLGDNTVGRVSSAIRSPRFGAIGLAILHYSAWQPGTELKVGENGTAVVADLPFK